MAGRPTAADGNPRVVGSVSVSAMALALATVISRPSSSHATPGARTMRVWNGDHGNRSRRAG
ncbi:MAG TPA: hypothetical protein VES60_12435 [Nakamurella sp.]|nr:hypothetical protein [Nakamurella sp.]